MFIILAVILGIIIGLIRGGSFRGFGARKIALLPLGIIGVALQAVLHLYYYTGGIAAIDAFLPVVNFVSYILILVTLVFNLDDIWTIMMAVGMTANFVVSFINGGKMPVAESVITSLGDGSAFYNSISSGSNAIYAMFTADSNPTLWFLGINIPIPGVGKVMQYLGSVGGFSVGGVIVFLGIVGWVQYAMNRSAEGKQLEEEPVGEEDFILSPTREEDEDAFFNEYEENLYGSNDEETLFEMKRPEPEEAAEAVVPDTENSDDEQHHAEEGALDSLPNSQDPVEKGADTTKVFTTINDLGTHETAEAAVPDAFQAEDEDEVDDDEPTGEPSGFFVQNFYAEKEKGKLAFEPDAAEAPEAAEPVAEDTPLMIKDEPIPIIFEEPEAVMAETPESAEPVNSNEIPEKESTMTERKTEDEMMNIWHQVNQENQRLRNKRRPQSRYTDVRDPFKAERERKAAEKAVAAAAAEEKRRFEEAAKRESVITPPETETETPRQPQSFDLPNLSTTKKESAESADAQRERAGYERVQLNIDGKDVVFWRKKKD